MVIKTFSPKEFAQVIGVSQSSIKRWVDAGLIHVTRTAGGHRRILLREAVRFIRDQHMDVLRPELLGLTDLQALKKVPQPGDLSGTALYRLLYEGKSVQARGLLLSAYLSGQSIPEIWDGPISMALTRFGELWNEEEGGVFLEHRATNVCLEAINQIRALLPQSPLGAPVALGGSPEYDPYLLANLIAASVLTECGYDAVNLGPSTPASALQHAIQHYKPQLIWLSLTSSVSDKELQGLFDLFKQLPTDQIHVILGGRTALKHQKIWPDDVTVLHTMSDLHQYATTLTTV